VATSCCLLSPTSILIHTPPGARPMAVLGLEQVRPPCVLLVVLGSSCCCYTSPLVRPRRPRCLTNSGSSLVVVRWRAGGSSFVVLWRRAAGLQLRRPPVARRWAPASRPLAAHKCAPASRPPVARRCVQLRVRQRPFHCFPMVTHLSGRDEIVEI
jgi:hypothetical protein